MTDFINCCYVSKMFDLILNSATLSFLLIILSLLYFIFPSSHRYRNKTPCPHSYPLIGNLIGFLRNRHRFHDWVTDLLSTTPSLTLQVNGLLGLSHGICTANPTNIDHLLRSNFPNYVKGSRFYSVLHHLLGHGIFNADDHLWSSQRKIASHEFNTKSLKNFISNTVQSQLSTRLIPYLSAASDTQQIIDLQHVLQKFTFDNICNVAFGVDPACLELELELDENKMNQNSLNSSFVRAFDYAVEVSSDRFMSPLPAIWKMKRFLNIGSEAKYREAITVINDFAMNIIRSKERAYEYEVVKAGGNDQDLLSRFMCSTSNLGFRDQDEKRKFLRDIVMSFILAGKDSTSTALTWFFWLIAGNPRCCRMIDNELSAIVSSDTWSGSFSYDELKKFHYLQAALSESMRLFPPVPINSRLTVMDDVLPDGTRVSKGWSADYSAYAMGRMERLWGPDCREYKPERWLDGDGVYQPSDQFKFPVFHCGPRMCLGKDMAYVQMKCIAAAVMYEFEVEAIDGGGCSMKMMDPPYTLSLLLKMRGGLRVRLKRRRCPNSLVS